MPNCFFEDIDCIIQVKPIELFCEDSRGRYILVSVRQKDVIKLIKNGVIPIYFTDKNVFGIYVRITNSTKLRINGIRIQNLSNLEKIPIQKINIRELALKVYSKKTQYYNANHYCYATRLIYQIHK